MAFIRTHLKLKAHIAQFMLIAVIISLTIARISLPNQFITRASILGLTMGIKSVVVLLYQVLTEHTSKFRRWASLKANLILNNLEIVFWAMVVGLGISSNGRNCNGLGCAFAWIVVILALVLCALSAYVAAISWVEYRGARRCRRGQKIDSWYTGHRTKVTLSDKP